MTENRLLPAQELIACYRDRQWTLATCESLTAGLLAATIADVAGASAVLRGGFITYETGLKHQLAGVARQTLATLGAVAEQTAIEMAIGARVRCHATVGASLTGVAGPDEQEGHPVGEVWIGVSMNQQAYAVRCDLVGDRRSIREQAVVRAIGMLSTLDSSGGNKQDS
ncbi:CinA family protein [Corynebacterium kutscheri]|uniref:CinA family protein n=1 Tax=Corynebacterium kutscheri TaxID=35755 RepID=UPI0037BF9188